MTALEVEKILVGLSCTRDAAGVWRDKSGARLSADPFQARSVWLNKHLVGKTRQASIGRIDASRH